LDDGVKLSVVFTVGMNEDIDVSWERYLTLILTEGNELTEALSRQYLQT
jgi:hypothetical protein